jgi:hypothetical protein
MKIYIILLIFVSSLFSSSVYSLDSGKLKLSLKNNKANILNFPFKIKTAKIASENPDDYSVQVNGYTVILIPTIEKNTYMEADLIVFSKEGDSFLINVNGSGTEQLFNLSTNRVVPIHSTKVKKFESGRIDDDIKKLMKAVILEKHIPGYKMTKIKRVFNTSDLEMQKDVMLDGSRYRVEKWYLRNKNNAILVLDSGDFYTKGVLAIAFKDQKIMPNATTIMWLVIDKSSFKKEKKY